MLKKKVLSCCSVLLLCLLPLFSATNPPVKVGFFAFDGYHEMAEDGTLSGYGYEFLQRVRRYSNLKFDYVEYNNTWSEMQQMLRDGDIVLLTSAQKTPSREAVFDFTDKSIGTSATILTVKSGNTDYIPGEYDSYEGMRVGMIEGNSRNESFAEFAQKKGFRFRIVYFNDNDAMVQALQEGVKIDAIVTSNLRKIQNEWILDQFDPSPFYAMVKKGNTELLDKINTAISALDINSPGWRTELFNTYYAPEAGAQISFDSKERKFIENARATGYVFTAVVNPDRYPYSSLDKSGKPEGLIVSGFEQLMSELGLKYTYLTPKTREEYENVIDLDKADIWIDAPLDYYSTESKGYTLTSPYMQTGIARLTRSGWSGTIKKVARLRYGNLTSMHYDQIFTGKEVVYYDNVKECIDAVISKEVDAVFVYAYTAQKIMQADIRNRLSFTLMPESNLSFTLALSDNQSRELLSILDKGVNVIKPYMDNLVSGEIATPANEDISVLDFIYGNPIVSIIIVVAFCILVFLTISLMIRRRNAVKRERRDAELARFMSYVCKTNDKVLEVNVQDGSCRSFRLQDDGRVEIDKLPYTSLKKVNPDDRIFPEDYEHVIAKITEDNLLDHIESDMKNEYYFEARWRPDTKSAYKWYSFTMQAIRKDAYHPENFILFMRNIDELKKEQERQKQALTDALTEAKSASEAKGTFLSRMSHEIRTPLNAIIGYMTIAQMSKDEPEKVAHCVENSAIAAKHLLSIINDVLDISSIESGKIKIANTDFNLKNLISTITSVFYNQAKNKGLQFAVAINDLTDEWVVGDQLRMNQVLMNLLSNSIKFTSTGGKVTLSVSQSTKVGESTVFIRFEVSDTGIGMSQEYLSRIFTPFEQESALTAQKFGGTGLGLSITKNLVTMMGGTITVESELGKGTVFKVQMKFDHSAENEKNHPLVHDFSHVRTLVADDDPESCEYIKALLKRCGVKSDSVLSGEAAIKQITRRRQTDHPYDLCILDWNMPGMNGIETAHQIRLQCSDQLPIIIATAYDISEIHEEAKIAGVTEVISKPLFQSTLFNLLVNTYGKYVPELPLGKPIMDLKGMRILLAEDNDMNMEIAKDILERSGIAIEGAKDGKQALDRFLEAGAGYYDAILMDVQMPVMDGYTATKEIRQSSAQDAKTIPIIAMTANAFTEDVTQAIASGMNDHISKPIDYNKLFNVLKKYIKLVAGDVK